MFPGGKMQKNFNSEHYTPKFSGHETFPLRFGWLKKSHDAFISSSGKRNTENPFKAEEAIATFGVGKNMVSAIQHWSEATGIIENTKSKTYDNNNENNLKISNFGTIFLSDDGFDPYLENISTLWLLHWNLVSSAHLTTWHWAFNYFALKEFSKEQLTNALDLMLKERNWSKRASVSTIKRDVDCFVRTYCPKKITAKETHEDSLESPLVELGLIYSAGNRDNFRFNIGEKPLLSDRVIAFAVMKYWQEVLGSSSNTLSLESVVFGPGSPGRTFLIGEDGLTQRLEMISEASHGLISWSETAGLKQLIRRGPFETEDYLKILQSEFSSDQSLGGKS